MFWIIILICTAIWLFGAILAIAIMLLINLTILGRSSIFDCYTRKEFILGFIASWATVYVVSKMFIDDF